MEIRESLDYNTYVDHSISLYEGAIMMLQQFHLIEYSPLINNTVKFLGYSRSASLLFALSVELIFKARALFEERELIEKTPGITFSKVCNKWGSNGHNIQAIIDCYGIEITQEEKKFIEELQPYMVWAGRFPFPMKDSEVIKYEDHSKFVRFSSKWDKLVANLINRQKMCMGYDTGSAH